MTMKNKAMVLAPLTLAILLGGCGGEAAQKDEPAQQKAASKAPGVDENKVTCPKTRSGLPASRSPCPPSAAPVCWKSPRLSKAMRRARRLFPQRSGADCGSPAISASRSGVAKRWR
jgi:hypothetical protein